METLGKKIALHRHIRQWTQERLAFEVNITQSTLSDIENGKTSPTLKLISEISKALAIPLIQLLPQEILGLPEDHPLYGMLDGNGKPSNPQPEAWQQLLSAKEELILAKDELLKAKDEQISYLRNKLYRMEELVSNKELQEDTTEYK